MVQNLFTISKFFWKNLYTIPRTKLTKSQWFPAKFSRENKKDRDRRQKGGRSLARSLPDSHGQPGYFAVFLNHARRNLLRPATSAHLIPTVRKYSFSVIWNLSACLCFHNASEQTCLQWFASAVFKHKAALRKQSGAAQAAGKNILFACLSMLLYHRNAAFAMNSARTKPVLYPNNTQPKPNWICTNP